MEDFDRKLIRFFRQWQRLKRQQKGKEMEAVRDKAFRFLQMFRKFQEKEGIQQTRTGERR